MLLLIKGKPAVIRKDSSVEYRLENRLFTRAEGYTLTISLPLRGCPENLAIFGAIHRVADVTPRNLIYDCEIRQDPYIRLRGSITVTEITPDEVKVQFLQGRSVQNFDTSLDAVYIDTLPLGRTQLLDKEFTPDAAWADGAASRSCVALPFYSRTDDEIHNAVGQWAVTTAGTTAGLNYWKGEPAAASLPADRIAWMPYLLELTRRICAAIRYTADLSRWEADPVRSLYLVANALPAEYARRDMAAILPHWSVAEYFDNLEAFLDCTFDIDHAAGSVTFRSNTSLIDDAGEIILDDIADEISSAVTAQDPSCDYVAARNLEYDSPGDWFDPDSCPWVLEHINHSRYPTFAAFSAAWRENRYTNFINFLAYIEELGIYVDRETISVGIETDNSNPGHPRYNVVRTLRPRQINTFGPLVADPSENAKSETIKIVPADVTWHESGLRCIHLSPGENPDDEEDDDEDGLRDTGYNLDSYEKAEEYIAENDFDTPLQILLENGQQDQAPFYDTLHIAYWDGVPFDPSIPPFPYTHDITIDDNATRFLRHPFSFRLTHRAPMAASAPMTGGALAPASDNSAASSLPSIDTRRKTTVRFLIGAARRPDGTPVPGIPSQNAVYNIRGKRYLCACLTATFTADAVSPLLKADLYPLLNS